MIVEISKYYIRKCEEFAEKQIETSHHLYRYRGEKNMEKMKEDIKIGKMGELGVYTYLKEHGYDPKKPDFKVYKNRNKSFDADILTICGKKIHVKSQGEQSVKRYGASWLLQKEDKITKFPTKDDFIVMCKVYGREVEILGAIEVKDLLEYNLLEEPRVPRYRHTKRALYFASLENSEANIYQLGLEEYKK